MQKSLSPLPMDAKKRFGTGRAALGVPGTHVRTRVPAPACRVAGARAAAAVRTASCSASTSSRVSKSSKPSLSNLWSKWRVSGAPPERPRCWHCQRELATRHSQALREHAEPERASGRQCSQTRLDGARKRESVFCAQHTEIFWLWQLAMGLSPSLQLSCTWCSFSRTRT